MEIKLRNLSYILILHNFNTLEKKHPFTLDQFTKKMRQFLGFYLSVLYTNKVDDLIVHPVNGGQAQEFILDFCFA